MAEGCKHAVVAETDAAPPLSRTDRRREQTRARLIAAARSLITEKAVSGLRINEITDHADVALGSFYNYFDSKEDIVDAVVSESLRELAETVGIPTAEDQDPAELVSDAIRRFVRLAYDDRAFAQLVVHLDHADALFVTVVYPAARRAVETGIPTGRFDVSDLEVTVTAIGGGALALMRAIVDDRLPAGAENSYAELALRALGVPDDEAAAIAARPLDAT
jgi:AcrR family transcriptional regulator